MLGQEMGGQIQAGIGVIGQPGVMLPSNAMHGHPH